jgi:hypothetical protein
MRIFGAVFFAMFLPFLALADEKTPPDGWREVSGGYKNLAYSVWMPADTKLDAKESSIVSKFGQIRVFRSVCQRKDGMMFAAGQINLPPTLVKESPKVRQAFFRESFLEEFDAKLVEEKNVKLGTMSGKEYTATTPKGLARYRLFGTGVQMFRVVVTGTKEQVESKDTDIFFDSFKRTRRGWNEHGVRGHEILSTVCSSDRGRFCALGPDRMTADSSGFRELASAWAAK